jgi:hypothetical protein
MDLTSKAMIATLSIKGIWSAAAEDESVTSEVARQHQVSEDLGRYLKRICDPRKIPTLKKFNSSRGALRILHRKMTLAWYDKGGRMLPSAAYFEYMNAIGAQKQRVIEDYDAFLNEIPTLKAKARVEMNALFHEEDWPDVDELRAKVDIRVRITPLADAADFRVQLGADEEAKIKAQVSKDLFANLAGGLAELVGQVKTCVQDTHARLAKYEVDGQGNTVHTFRDTAITNLREIVADARKLNVIGDPTLTALLDEIDGSLCQKDPQTLRDNFVQRQQAVNDADAIAKKLANVESVLCMQAEAA